jgi:histidinol-phosphate aminotransferase
MRIDELARENFKELSPFSTLRDEYGYSNKILLDANESPYNNGYNRYPDPYSKELKKVYSDISGIPYDNLFAGNGSDEIIDLLVRVFCEPRLDSILCLTPSYGMYKTSATINNIRCIEVPLNDDFSLDSARVLDQVEDGTKIIFLCSPNNPTGNSLLDSEVTNIISRFKGLVVVDEAYIDFSQNRSFASAIVQFENLIVLRTLSKAWGMAGLRVGFAIASKEVIVYLNKIKYPYNLSTLSQEKAIELLLKGNKNQVEPLIYERENLIQKLLTLSDVTEVYPSETNFLLVKFIDHRKVFLNLIKKGLFVRDLSCIKGCENTLRISIGSQSENSLLLAILDGSLNDNALKLIDKVRSTKETTISVRIDPYGNMKNEIITRMPFIDHMLEQIPVHSGFSMRLLAEGDLQNGPHHTIEDIAIVLGESLYDLLASGNRCNRYGFSLPMDESESNVMIDFSRRAFLRWEVIFPVPYIEGIESDMFRHFFDTLSKSMKASIHIKSSGLNAHHIIESIFKAFAKSLEMILIDKSGSLKLKSSKGVL